MRASGFRGPCASALPSPFVVSFRVRRVPRLLRSAGPRPSSLPPGAAARCVPGPVTGNRSTVTYRNSIGTAEPVPRQPLCGRGFEPPTRRRARGTGVQLVHGRPLACYFALSPSTGLRVARPNTAVDVPHRVPPHGYDDAWRPCGPGLTVVS